MVSPLRNKVMEEKPRKNDEIYLPTSSKRYKKNFFFRIAKMTCIIRIYYVTFFPTFLWIKRHLDGQINGVALRHKLEMTSKLRQMRESTLCQTLHVCIVNDTQNIQFMDWPQCVL